MDYNTDKLDNIPHTTLSQSLILEGETEDILPDYIDAGTKISLGDRMKSYEKTDMVPAYQSFIVRADGNSFSKYTKGFPKPFDAGFSRAMIRTANGVMNHFNARTVFVCSDEITVIFHAVCTKSEYDDLLKSDEKNLPTHIFAGRHNKIESLVASKCSVLFNKFMLQESKESTYSDKTIEKIKKCDAIFDARMVPIPIGSEIEIVNNIIWRSCYDCYRNTVSAYGRHYLGQKECHNKNCREMIVMMKEKGFDFDTQVNLCYKFGTLCKKILITLTNDKNEQYIRSKDYNFCCNLIKEDRLKTLELFFDKYFYDKIKSTEYKLD